MSRSIEDRKADHLALCAGDQVGFRQRTTLLEEVQFVHQALPDLSWDELDTSIELIGRRLTAPVYISAMTGGTEEAARINRDLALAAQELGIGMGLGSQRPILKSSDHIRTYSVREYAPDILLFGNLGIAQAQELSTDEIEGLVGAVGADAMCIHLNPAMELVQPEGDRDFSRGEETLARLSEELSVPLIVKEVGSGLSPEVADACVRAGVAHVDVAGAGGTSWVGVEVHRSNKEDREIGEMFWDWGIPTAASVLMMGGRGLTVLASGGLRTGLDMAKCLALGATAAGLAAPALKAQRESGTEGVVRAMGTCIDALKTAMFLVGCRRPEEMTGCRKVLGPELRAWVEQTTEGSL